MKPLSNWLNEKQQVMLAHIANRTFRNRPGFLDRLALWVLAVLVGKPEEEDPELEH